MRPIAPLAHVGRYAWPSLPIALLRSSGARLLTAAILALPFAARGNGALLVVDRTESHVDISVKSTLDSFVAHLEDFEIAITLDPENGRVEAAAFHADLSAVKTGLAQRDHNMGEWLQAKIFPQVVFELGAVDRGPDGSLAARGRFQLHGQMHDMRFPVTVAVSGGSATIDGTATLDTQEYGLPIIRFWMLTVDPVVHVHFHLQGRLGNHERG